MNTLFADVVVVVGGSSAGCSAALRMREFGIRPLLVVQPSTESKAVPQIMNAYVLGVCSSGRDSVRESTSPNAASITEEQVSA